MQLLNFTGLSVAGRKLAGMQQSIGNLQYNIAEMWGQVALNQFLCSLSFVDLQSKTNLVALFCLGFFSFCVFWLLFF